MKILNLLLTAFVFASMCISNAVNAQVTATIGTGTTSATTYGVIYRSSATSAFDFSRYHYIYTASELSAAGISPGASISELKWYLNSTSLMSGTGNATLKIYIKNSLATVATTNTWANLIAGSTQVVNSIYNTTNNFPGVIGWMPFTFGSAFVYTGGSLEISVDWDCSAITGNPTTGAFNWLYGTAPATLTSYANNSTLPASTTSTSTNRPNIQIVHTAPACAGPVGLMNTALTTTSANFSWTAVGGAAGYNWVLVAAGAGSGGTPVASGSTAGTTAAVTSLSPNTSYDFYVQTDCGGGTLSLFGGPLQIYTGYCQVVSTNAASYFDAFTTTGGSTNISNTTSGYATNGYQDATAMVVSQYAGASVNFATTLVGTTVGVNIWVDWNNDLVFSAAEKVYASGAYVSTASGTITVPGGTPIGNYRMRIRCDYNATDPSVCGPSGSGRNETEDYTFAVVAAPSCVPPTTLTATGLTSTSANLGWTSTASNWQVQYGAQGFALGTGTMFFTSSNPHNLTGLTPNTAYGYYVRAICSAGDTSLWSGPFAFTTPCTAYNIPYFEGFESGYTDNTIVAGCLSQESILGTSSWTANNTLTSYNRIPRTGAWNAFLQYSNTDWLYIPVNLVGGTSYTADVYTRQDGATLTDADVTISYGTANNAAAMTNAIVAATGITNGNYQLLRGTFTPATSGVYYVGIKGYMNSTPWYISIDDIAIYETPNCPAPTALTATPLTYTSVDLGWTSAASNFQIQHGSQGFVLGTGTMAYTSSNPHNLTSLTANTSYTFYVRSVCGVNDTSAWAGPLNFYTGPCFPNPSSVDGTGITNVTMGSINNTSVAEFGNYGNYMNQSTTVEVGSTLPINITLATGYTYNLWAWIDWNADLDFNDANEEYYLGESTSANPTVFSGSIVIPTNAVVGNYRIRIGGADSGLGSTSPSNPCYTGLYGTFEDYTLNVICNAATITTEPIGLTVCTGVADSFVVVATGSVLSYQWQKNSSNLSGATSSHLVLNNIAAGDAGNYMCIVTSACGIDNSVVVSLNVNTPTTSTFTHTACGSYTWINGNTYTSSNNTATHTLTGSNGCDSVVTLNLTINTPTSSTDTRTACNSYTWIDGNTYTTSNSSATHTVTGSNGCDSVITLNLTINTPTTGTDTHTTCGSFTWIDGNTYTSSNATATHTIVGGAANGCDSVVTLNLTINSPTTGTDIQDACNTFTWIDGNTYTSSNSTATHTLTGANGCDSVVTLNLTITTVDTSVTDMGMTLMANATGATYQWVDCNNGNAPISGANSQSFTPVGNGDYAVEVTVNGCVSMSSCYNITGVAVQTLNATTAINLYPNPTENQFTVDFGTQVQDATLRILAVDGRVLQQHNAVNGNQFNVSLTDYPAAIYFVEVIANGQSTMLKVTKNNN